MKGGGSVCMACCFMALVVPCEGVGQDQGNILFSDHLSSNVVQIIAKRKTYGTFLPQRQIFIAIDHFSICRLPLAAGVVPKQFYNHIYHRISSTSSLFTSSLSSHIDWFLLGCRNNATAFACHFGGGIEFEVRHDSCVPCCGSITTLRPMSIYNSKYIQQSSSSSATATATATSTTSCLDNFFCSLCYPWCSRRRRGRAATTTRCRQ